jgi:hypothetical protein
MTQRIHLLFLVLAIFAFAASADAQYIQRPYPFTINSRDTVTTPYFPSKNEQVAGAKGNVTVTSDGHFISGGERLKFFGTELQFDAAFLTSTDARDLARHLKKLGFNAVRLRANDYTYSAPSSFFDYPNGYPKNSYLINNEQLAKFDTLVYEMKQAGIYMFMAMNSEYHYYYPQDTMISYTDSLWGGQGYYQNFFDNGTAKAQRNWVKTLLSHTNPLTGKRVGDEPSIAGIELYNIPGIYYAWRYNYLNYVDTNNHYSRGGASTISFHQSRKLDTLFTQYLKKKYTSDAGINLAWKGSGSVDLTNRIANGSFENITSPAWSFTVANGATGGKATISPAKDSQYCLLAQIDGLSTNPVWNDAYLYNVSARCGKDTLYQISFWAKIKYNPANAVKARNILLYFYDYGGAAGAALSQYVDIDTSWKQYTYSFRALASGLHGLYVGVGQSLGDVQLDGFVINQKEEVGLYPGESSTINSIYRIKYGEGASVSIQRARDMGIFYDSLQRSYYTNMMKAVRDTVKAKVLMSFYDPDWWGTVNDAHAMKTADFTTSSVQTDYMRTRDGMTYSDSTLRITNMPMLSATGASVLSLLAAQSLEGKPFVAKFLNPNFEQYYSQAIPFLATYAAYQDWDGLFIRPYSTYKQSLFADSIYPAKGGYEATAYDIQGNPGILSLLPSASAIFRNGYVKVAGVSDSITHDPDDVMLASKFPDYRHPFGTEGYIDPNIVTALKVRQKFDATRHKVAAQYPYVPDTSAKVSDHGEIYWQQSSMFFKVNSDKANIAIGFFGPDSISLSRVMFRRLDGVRENLSLSLVPLDDKPLTTSSSMLLTLVTRGQNNGMQWQDSIGIGKNWGGLPTVMSAAQIELTIKSDSGRVVFHPLDPAGMPITSYIDAKKNEGSNTFKITLEQYNDATPWYWIEHTNAVNAVRLPGGAPEFSSLAVYPNPAKQTAKALLKISRPELVTLSVSNVLGVEVLRITSERLESGSYEFPLELSALAEGTYILRAEVGGERLTRTISVIK